MLTSHIIVAQYQNQYWYFYLSSIHDFLASKIGHIENIGSLIYADLINVSIFHYIL